MHAVSQVIQVGSYIVVKCLLVQQCFCSTLLNFRFKTCCRYSYNRISKSKCILHQGVHIVNLKVVWKSCRWWQLSLTVCTPSTIFQERIQADVAILVKFTVIFGRFGVSEPCVFWCFGTSKYQLAICVVNKTLYRSHLLSDSAISQFSIIPNLFTEYWYYRNV